MYKNPMKAETVENGNYLYPCYVSEKLDGWRCLIMDGVMYTSSGKPFKPNVQARFKPVIDAAHRARLVLDGELYIKGNDDFGSLASTLSASQEVMQESGLRFYCFDVITLAEWQGQCKQEPFENRLDRLADFTAEVSEALFEPVHQYWCESQADAQEFYSTIKAKGGEGIMMRAPTGLYESSTRSKDIVKWKVWRDCSARVVEIHQLACPVQYAQEVKTDENGNQHGYKLQAGSVTVQILPDQPLPAGAYQNCMFTGDESIELRDSFWTDREQMVGKIVDFQYLPGGTVGRMARIFRIREDITDGQSADVPEKENLMTGILSFFTGGIKSADKPFFGKTVAFTGTLQVGGRKMLRTEAQRIVQSLGGNVVTGESGKIRNANLLVLGVQAGTRTKSQKMDAAADRQVQTITAEQFFRMIG